MKKKYFVMGLAALFMLFTATSCNNKSKKEKDDTEKVEDEKDDAEEKDDYLTQDLASFDLRGEVIAVKYTGDEHTEPVVVQFNDDGSLKDIHKMGVEGNADKGIIVRDEKKRIISIAFESQAPWTTFLSYDDGSMLPQSCIESNQMGNYTCTTYERDEDGNIVKVEFEEGVHGYDVDHPEETVIKLTDQDSHGNWLRCTTTQGEYSTFIQRTIIYKGEENAFAAELKEALEGDPAIFAFIKSMYENQLYYDKEFLEHHCTKRMLQHLRDEYDYDGEGYAIWLFRTSAQDGKPGAEGVIDKVLSITKDSEGWYHYTFTDGGWRGENKLKAHVENGEVMIDDLKSVYDEGALTY